MCIEISLNILKSIAMNSNDTILTYVGNRGI